MQSATAEPTVSPVPVDEPPPPADAAPSPAAGTPGGPPGGARPEAVPLDYANPWPQWVAASPRATEVFWLGVRRVITAGGAGLLTWGLASMATGINRHAAAVAAGWGLAFLVLTLPLRLRLPRRRAGRKRRRRAARVSIRPGCGI